MFYLTTHSTHFIYGYMASDIWLRTILIVRKETRCRHIGYSYRLTARVLLYALSHRQDNTYHGLCYTSRNIHRYISCKYLFLQVWYLAADIERKVRMWWWWWGAGGGGGGARFLPPPLKKMKIYVTKLPTVLLEKVGGLRPHIIAPTPPLWIFRVGHHFPFRTRNSK